MSKKLTLTEEQIVADLLDFINDCDADSLCAMFEHVFGMSGVVKGIETDVYEFEPVEGEYCDHRRNELK